MTAPVRLRLSRAKGFDLQAHSKAINGLEALNVARPTIWGNPFPVQKASATRGGEPIETWVVGTWDGPAMWVRDSHVDALQISVNAFRAWITHPGQASLLENARVALRGKNLACWCRPGDPCHADVLLEIANG
jgi:hypothetical protein